MTTRQNCPLLAQSFLRIFMTWKRKARVNMERVAATDERNKDMNVIERIRIAARNRAAYRRTVAALRSMPLDIALDLDIARDDAALIARRAVYGA